MSNTNVNTVILYGENCESHHPKDTTVYQQLSSQNTSDPSARHYQQQPTEGENKLDSRGERNEEEVLEVDRTHIEESTQLHHKSSADLESSRSKEKRKTEEYITPRNLDRHEENEQKLDRTRKDSRVQSGLKNASRRPMLHWE
ncbi:unnamed protein product [Schistosoma margrebowiei]|uniref:Uncharacterized protein n=1 Tax=Schistosoma margrebowiei TaxID=48269 RepID=A0A183MFF6_9TREM|nr:unnamed protein product [Schistosoma margrebowiei]